MRKKTEWNMSSVILFIVGVIMISVALYLLVPTLLDYKKSGDTYDTLREGYVVAEVVESATTEVMENENWWYEDVDINLTGLKRENPDIVGWIRFDNIDILSYPVLYSGDDEKYLRTDIYGNSTTAGCIFMEGACNPDFQDCHTILYGHNMRNLSMFGSLKKYKTEDFYKDHQYFTIYTSDMAYRYRIFSYRDVPETDDVYTVGFEADDTFGEFIGEMVRHSYEDTGIDVTKDDKVMTLSTCSTEGNRFVVHAVRVDEHAYEGGK